MVDTRKKKQLKLPFRLLFESLLNRLATSRTLFPHGTGTGLQMKQYFYAELFTLYNNCL